MSYRSRQALLLVPFFALVAPIAQAAESGQIRGRVFDESGAPLAGAEVTVSGEGIAGELKEVSASDGQFRFISVPPGSHDVLVLFGDYAPVRMQVDVRLDEASFVPVTMRMPTTANEEIVVEAALPVVDATSCPTSCCRTCR
jgi:hypothetical protein